MLQRIITILFLLITVTVYSQRKKEKTDTLLPFREFAAVCNLYKQMPVQLSLHYQKTTTFPVEEEDTANTTADFYLTPKGTYIKFGNLEQIANDSFIVMISNEQQMMMLFENTINIQQRFSNYMGFQMADSSVLKMAKEYSAVFLPGSEGRGIIELKNRSPLPGTDMIKEIITVTYNEKTKDPQKVVHLRRSIIPIEKEDWESFAGKETVKDKLLIINDHYFLLNERNTVYDYKNISHSSDMKLPVTVGERVVRNTKGELVPAKGYEEYHLTVD
jgi:hypothetical protein